MARQPWFCRPDGTYLKHIDPFMRFFPYVMKGRNESAIYFKQQIDVTALKAYIHARNRQQAASGDGGKTTLFHAVLAATVKTIAERPQLNRFIIGRRIYQRHQITAAFIIKSEFNDDAKEEIAVMAFNPEDTLSDVSARLRQEISKVREEARASSAKRHGGVNWLVYFMKLPRLVLRGLVGFLEFLDYHGWLPRFVIDADPMHTSLFVTNLGSLSVDAPYHHLYEWGTTSTFMTIGVVGKAPVVTGDGAIEVREVMNIGFTLDERISDGYYFAKTIKRFQYFLEHPEELEKPSKAGRP
jgi:pyruvate/2-oxoglutarate dehydrogenase complex dihydrolipoamide acyltransferase (E2) component